MSGDRCPPCRRCAAASGRGAAGAAGLAAGRRPGRVAVRADGRRRSAGLPARAKPADVPVMALGRRLEPDRPRRRRAGRGGAARQGLRRGRASSDELGSVAAAAPRSACLAPGAQRPGSPGSSSCSHPRHGRRLRADERRRLWRRGQGGASIGLRWRSIARAARMRCRSPSSASPIAIPSCPPARSSSRARFRGQPGEPPAIQAEMDRISAEREATQPLRVATGGTTFKNPPAARQGLAAGRRGRLPRAAPWAGRRSPRSTPIS